VPTIAHDRARERDAAVGGGVGDRPRDEEVRAEHEQQAQRQRTLA
jgi:hypothetical protein